MTNKIFRNIIASVLLAVAIVITLFFNVLYNEQLNNIEANLREEIVFVEKGIETSGTDYLNDINISQRVTIINPSGEVIYDNHTNVEKLENHSDREEVMEAYNLGWGSARRHSESVNEQSIYVAKLMDDGNILRISTSTDSAHTLLLKMSTHILWILIIVLIVTFIVASRLAKKITKPINDIDLDNLENIPAYKELTPLHSKLQRQSYTINKQLQELNKRQDEFKLVTQNMNEGIIVINKEANILSYNPAVLKLFNVGKIDDRSSIYELYRSQEFMQAVSDVLKGEKRDFKINFDSKIYNIIMGPVKNEDESIAGATIISFDITEKESQEIMRQEFTASVSHELKTPLTTISGFAEILKNGLAEDGDVQNIGAHIYDEAQRLIKLVEDIIHLSSLDTGVNIEKMEEVNLTELVKTIFNHHKIDAQKKNISLEYKGEEVKYRGTYSILEEMINNLVDNAIKYGKDNGCVLVEILKNDKEVTISVKDNGIGIPNNVQDRIFERFYRVDKSRSKELGGTGLGLSIVKHAAQYHKGKVVVKSSEEGSTFIVSLPIIEK